MIDTKYVRNVAKESESMLPDRHLVIVLCDEIDRLTAEVERLKAENVHWQEAIGRDSELIEELHLKLESSDMLTDGFGNYYKATCSKCGAPMQVVRPGDIRCSEECYIKDEEAEG